ncbi:hypothetical protein [Bradyrhizobium mercantei]|uniref:hypothetical protein n=1 Tax=Bradyrhizobium mercantei TaxID=1904807 RepID=UPI0013563D49|nr:hypothetical protein [Bradyrhizobium mercantei]
MNSISSLGGSITIDGMNAWHAGQLDIIQQVLTMVPQLFQGLAILRRNVAGNNLLDGLHRKCAL